MQLKVLCVGDVVGAPGRRVLSEAIPAIVRRHQIDCVIVNAENAAGGSGLTPAIFEKILHYGVHVVTLGDHIYRRREIISVLERSDRIVRPANLPVGAPGKDHTIYVTDRDQRVAVISLLGRIFMKRPFDCPFAVVDRVLAALPRDIRIIIVDMHAEATSEKVAMGWHLDGRVSAVFGTHTHVPTADEHVLPKGTAYVTDVGMTGPYDSVLGRDKQRVLAALVRGLPDTLDVASGDVRLCGAIVSIESTTGLATGIERIVFNGTVEA